MVYVLLGQGFEEMETIAPIDLLRRAGISVTTVGVTGKVVTGSHGIAVTADMEIGELNLSDCEMIVLPGGLEGVKSARQSSAALHALSDCWKKGVYVAAICAGPTVLADLHITDGKRATCYPGCEAQMGGTLMVENAAVVTDGKLITGTSAGCATAFALELIRALRGEEKAREVADKIVIR